MTVNTRSDRTRITDRVGVDSDLASSESIADGVEAAVGDVASVTIYLRAQASVTVTVELSPDGGESWYEMSESPVTMTVGSNATEATETVHLEYNTTRVRLTGDSAADVDAQVREVV